MVKIKICGITNLLDACAAVTAGADALGFVFYKKSQRYISPAKARQAIKKLPKRVLKAGVFVNSDEDLVRQIAKNCSLDLLQFHGRESVQFCQKFKKYRVIKSFRIKDRISFAKILQYKTFAYLFDTFVKSLPGGTGKSFNLALLKGLKKTKAKVILSGGLNSRNVRGAVKAIRPDWVDVSSSVERKPGKKDHQKVKDFIRAAKSIAL